MRDALVRLLHEGGYSLVVWNGNTRTFTRRGVTDLYNLLLHEPDFLRGALVMDKVVGKGAAALIIMGGVAELHADVISEAALALLGASDVKVVGYDRLVTHIVNREGTGMCPVETLCKDAKTAEECLPLIHGFMKRQRA
ncbi:MAG: DUF1893 domain-containing protein [Bacteroidaceae bacterium]|nr:DUF1893 domain-containing protein [Bacteroidaceae bacterium]